MDARFQGSPAALGWLNGWLKAKPKSINARLSLAKVWESYAFFARGGKMAEHRTAYKTYIANVLTAAGDPDAAAKAARIYDLEMKIAAAHASRVQNVSVLTSAPHLARHTRPRASRTDMHGCEPAACSSTKTKGGAGAPSLPPGPATKSICSTGPGSRQSTDCVDRIGASPACRRFQADRSHQKPRTTQVPTAMLTAVQKTIRKSLLTDIVMQLGPKGSCELGSGRVADRYA